MSDEIGPKPIDDIPYVFDLLWDIKSRATLMKRLALALEDSVSFLELIQEQQIEMTEMEELIIQGHLQELRKYIIIY